MTVAELIEKLRNSPPDAEVWLTVAYRGKSTGATSSFLEKVEVEDRPNHIVSVILKGD